jgi:hypothetical protein
MATRTQSAAPRYKKAVQSYARTGGKVMHPLCSVWDPRSGSHHLHEMPYTTYRTLINTQHHNTPPHILSQLLTTTRIGEEQSSME